MEEADGREGVDEPALLRGRTRLREMETYRLSPYIQIAASPTNKKTLGLKIIADNSAPDFIGAIRTYVHPFSPMFAEIIHDRMEFSVWSRVTLHHDRLPFAPLAGRKIDHIRASPATYDRFHRLQRQPQFDTVLVSDASGQAGLHRMFLFPNPRSIIAAESVR